MANDKDGEMIINMMVKMMMRMVEAMIMLISKKINYIDYNNNNNAVARLTIMVMV